MTNLVIYHAQCPDGFTAAWVARSVLESEPCGVAFHEGVYGQDPPSVTGRNVYLLDFTYPPDHMHAISKAANTLVVLDHHQTALANCAAFPNDSNTTVLLDMNRSGARIAWDYWYTGQPAPDIVRFVEDRDLWRFRYEDDTRDYHAALTSRPYTFEAWDEVYAMPLDTILTEGAAVNRYRDQLIAQACDTAAWQEVCGVLMPVANCPYAYASDVAGELAKRNTETGVAAYFYDHLAAGTRNWGLRSTPDGIDVATLAEKWGGGGHRHAAGFKTAIPH
jgi:oligoribonuclease NrnB/cAMP/cGMP phosphodiesterase (DHH superfamily)